LISLSAWRQWHVVRDEKLVRLFDLKDPAKARRRGTRPVNQIAREGITFADLDL
jgi:hypothetical protein